MKKFHCHLMESSQEFCNISKNVHYGKVIVDECAGELICGKCGVVLEEKTSSYIQDQIK